MLYNDWLSKSLYRHQLYKTAFLPPLPVGLRLRAIELPAVGLETLRQSGHRLSQYLGSLRSSRQYRRGLRNLGSALERGGELALRQAQSLERLFNAVSTAAMNASAERFFSQLGRAGSLYAARASGISRLGKALESAAQLQAAKNIGEFLRTYGTPPVRNARVSRSIFSKVMPYALIGAGGYLLARAISKPKSKSKYISKTASIYGGEPMYYIHPLLIKIAEDRALEELQNRLAQLRQFGVLNYPDVVQALEIAPPLLLGVAGIGLGGFLGRRHPLAVGLGTMLGGILGGFGGYKLGQWLANVYASDPERLALARKYGEALLAYRRALGLSAPSLPSDPVRLMKAISALTPAAVKEEIARQRLEDSIRAQKAALLSKAMADQMLGKDTNLSIGI